MKIYSIIILCFLISGCDNGNPGTQVQVNDVQQNASFGVVKLFNQDNCSVYRFYDAGYYRYYTSCKGESINLQRYSCGKGQICTSPDNISTN